MELRRKMIRLTLIYKLSHNLIDRDRAKYLVGGTGGRETGRKGGGRCTGGVREAGEEGAGGGKREKNGKNYATLRNISQSKKCKGREPKNTGWEPGLKGTGSVLDNN